MFKRKISLRVRKIHRYLGLFIGLQFLAWTISGLYFSWTDIDEIHGDQFLKPQKEDHYSELIDLDKIPAEIVSLVLVTVDQVSYYWINESSLYNAKTGVQKGEITEAEALSVVKEKVVETFVNA